MQKTTYLLIVLIIMTMSFSVVRRKDFFIEADTGRQENAKAERQEQAKRHFPTADYNEPDLPDSEENRRKKEKQKRFNNLMKWVSATPQSHIVENLAVPEGLFNFPALPVKTSGIVIIGVVGSTKAHLSENKRNVFSEFMVAVETVFKTSDQEVTKGSVLTVDRIGGFVRYPNGHKILYRISGTNMPKIGARYLFFLDSINKHDYTILTAYELTERGVIPLDTSSQFEVLEGTSETEVIQRLRRLLLNTSN